MKISQWAVEAVEASEVADATKVCGLLRKYELYAQIQLWKLTFKPEINEFNGAKKVKVKSKRA